MSDPEQNVVVITGASAGVGKATAEAFARMGWHVIATGRNPVRCDQAEADIRSVASPGACVDFLRGDFCEMADVKRIASEIAEITDRIDVLINNAGGVRDQQYISSEGLEATMAANHFAPFVLTRELLPILKATAEKAPTGSVRVIAVSSAAHESCPVMRWEDLFWSKDYVANGIYCQAKLANLLFARELSRRVSSDGIISQAMHPGVVDSNFGSHGDDFMRGFMENRDDKVPPERPARTLVWMATSPEAGEDPGRYFYDMKEVPAAPHALDDEAASRLWDETEKILATLGA